MLFNHNMREKTFFTAALFVTACPYPDIRNIGDDEAEWCTMKPCSGPRCVVMWHRM